MKAIVWQGKNKVELKDVEDPRIESSTDAIVRLTSSGICGSDLHMYEERTSAKPGMVLGHENMGVIVEVGEAVQQMQIGERVVMPFNIACGSCFNCVRGMTSACLTMNRDAPTAGYGYAGMGPFKGGQAEYLRVPYADYNCLKLPGDPGDAFEDDFLLLSDVFPTGYHGAVLANVQPGSSVAIFGAGPVGLMAALSSSLRGAAKVFVVDSIPERLKLAETIGATPIDLAKGDPAKQIREMREADPMVTGSLRRGEERMLGVMCGIDAVGYQARDETNLEKESPTAVLESLAEIVNPTGSLGIVGVYPAMDPGGKGAGKKGVYPIPFGTFFEKGIKVGLGQTPVKQYNLALRDLICAGKARPSFIVSHRLSLSQAVEAYDKFDKREDGYTKVILKPSETSARAADGMTRSRERFASA